MCVKKDLVWRNVIGKSRSGYRSLFGISPWGKMATRRFFRFFNHLLGLHKVHSRKRDKRVEKENAHWKNISGEYIVFCWAIGQVSAWLALPGPRQNSFRRTVLASTLSVSRAKLRRCFCRCSLFFSPLSNERTFRCFRSFVLSLFPLLSFFSSAISTRSKTRWKKRANAKSDFN